MKSLKILVTGGGGQLGQSLIKTQPRWVEHIEYVDRDTLDIADKESLAAFIDRNEFNLCINTAAYTNVDKAEVDEHAAYAVNAEAVAALGILCSERSIPVIHYSTDYVYDNGMDRPLREADKLSPRSVYAKSKLQGEQRLMESNPESTVIRTSWVFSEFGHNFVRTMLRLGAARDALSVVDDQRGCPTYAPDLAAATWTIVMAYSRRTAHPGVFNFCNSGETTWYEFAREIFRQAAMEVRVDPTTTDSFGAPAPRPAYSVLDCSRIADVYGIVARHWTDALSECLRSIKHATKREN